MRLVHATVLSKEGRVWRECMLQGYIDKQCLREIKRFPRSYICMYPKGGKPLRAISRGKATQTQTQTQQGRAAPRHPGRVPGAPALTSNQRPKQISDCRSEASIVPFKHNMCEAQPAQNEEQQVAQLEYELQKASAQIRELQKCC